MIQKRRASATAERFQGADPRALADLMLIAPLRRRANLLVLAPGRGGDYTLLVKRGSATVAEIPVDAEAGNAAVARLAAAGGLDPLALRPPGAAPPSARVKVRAGHDRAELLVSACATPHGLEAEVRPILINGAALEQPARGHLKRCVRCAAFHPPLEVRCTSDGGDLIEVSDDPRPGGTIGVYRLIDRIGDGGMGTVFAAEHALIGRPVAVKLPHLRFAEDAGLVRQFLAEARAAGRVHHPSIVDVTDYGLIADGRPYMVMERISGASVRDRLDAEGALPPLFALLIAREVAAALAAAHDGGVIHRDLKPDNIILLEGTTDALPRLKLVDFGAAIGSGQVDADGLILGTPWYMAPEHSRGEPVDARTDVYALGVVLFEMLSGAVPYDAGNEVDVRMAHITEPIPAVVSPHEPLPEPIARVVARALRKVPDERYQSAAEMIGDLERAISVYQRRDWRRWLPL